MELTHQKVIFGCAVEQPNIRELVVEEGVDCLHVVGNPAEKGWFWHVFFYLIYSYHLRDIIFDLLLPLHVLLPAFYLRS